VALSERFGKLPFADLMQPAIEWPSAAMRCRWSCSRSGQRAPLPELTTQPGFAEAFLPWGRAPQVGELFRLPEPPPHAAR
jgi:gamma-glutamyltranspeptidase / glutathione hydrolase